MKKFIVLIYVLVALIQLPIVSVNGQVAYDSNGKIKWMVFEDHGRKGAMDMSGHILVPAKYKSVESYNNGKLFQVNDFLGKKGLYNDSGKEVIPCKYYVITLWSGIDSLVAVYDSNNWLIYDLKGNCLVSKERKIKELGSFVQKYGFRICYYDENNKAGAFDETLKDIIPLGKYNLIMPLSTKDKSILFGCYEFKNGNKCDIYDNNGHFLATSNSPYIQISQDYSGKEYILSVGDVSNGRIELDGSVISQASIKKVSAGTAKIKNNTFYFYLNSNHKLSVEDAFGREVIPAIYDNVSPVNSNGQYGFVLCNGSYRGWADEKGNIRVEPDKYTQVVTLSNNLCCRCTDGTREIRSSEGKLIISNKYGNPTSVKNSTHGTFATIQNYQTGLISLYKCVGDSGNAEQVTPFMYSDFTTNDGNSDYFYPLNELGHIGIIDYKGNIISYPKYTSVSYNSNGKYFSIKDGNYCGILMEDKSFCIEPTEFTYIYYKNDDKTFVASGLDHNCIFSYDGKVISDSHPAKEFNENITMADEAFEKGNYDIASEYYSKALLINKKAYLYYNRGICHYNNGNYDMAISDFNTCLDNNPSTTTRTNAYDMIDKSNYYKTQKRQQRVNKAFNILGAIFNAASTILTGRNMNYYNTYNTYDASIPSYSNCYTPTYSSNVSSVTSNTSSSKNSNAINCPACNNSGKCSYCNGSGYGTYGGIGLQSRDKSKVCSHCHGSTICSVCNGNHR